MLITLLRSSFGGRTNPTERNPTSPDGMKTIGLNLNGLSLR